MDTLLQDVRYAFRTLLRQPGFTAVAVLTLAIGIGANTAIYSVVDATLLRTLPFRDPDRLMKVSLVVPGRNGMPRNDDVVWSGPKYDFFRQHQQVYSGTALYRAMTFNLTGAGEPEQIHAEEVGGAYFQVLGIEPRIGRAFRPDEDVVPHRDLVAVISHGLWERRFGSDPQIAGRTVGIEQHTFTIVGVLPAGFQGLSGPADIWIPAHALADSDLTQPQSHSWDCVARLKPGIAVDQARAAVTTLGVEIGHAIPDIFGASWGAKARTLAEARVDPAIRTSVLVLLGAVSFVLLIACVNVANLLLARGAVRQREIAIRLAVGANRLRLIRQLLTESVVLSVVGAAASLALAWWGVGVLSAINPVAGNPFGRRISGLTVLGLSSIRLDSRALLFTFGIALFTGILFGMAPAIQASRASVSGALKNAGARFSVAAAAGKGALVVVEVALAMVLLVGAGLMIKSFGRLLATSSGVDTQNVLTLRIAVPGRGGDPAAAAFFTALRERVAALPGVVSASLGNCYPLAGGCSATIATFPDRPPVSRGSEPLIGVPLASPDYLRTMRIPLLRGRWFTDADRAESPRVVVINETAAKRFWPGEDPVGKRLGLGMNGFGDGAEVIGIVADVRYQQLDIPPRPDAYITYRQSPRGAMVLSARTAGNPAALAPLVERELHVLNKNLPAFDIKTMEQRVRDSTARSRFSAILLAVFAFIAMSLAAVGIYGVMSFLVTQRTREIGIRIALGAGSGDVLGLMLRRGAALAVGGIVLGIAGAIAATRVLGTMLYEVKPGDPQTFATIAGVLTLVALLATYIPARRATGVDAATALRSE